VKGRVERSGNEGVISLYDLRSYEVHMATGSRLLLGLANRAFGVMAFLFLLNNGKPERFGNSMDISASIYYKSYRSCT